MLSLLRVMREVVSWIFQLRLSFFTTVFGSRKSRDFLLLPMFHMQQSDIVRHNIIECGAFSVRWLLLGGGGLLEDLLFQKLFHVDYILFHVAPVLVRTLAVARVNSGY